MNVVFAGKAGDKFVLKHLTREVRVVVAAIEARYDLTSGERVVTALGEGSPAASLGTNDLGSVRLRLAEPLAVDRYEDLRTSGSFLLVDGASGETLAGGMIR